MKKILKDYSKVLFGSGMSRGVAFLNSVLAARMLGPDDFGRFSVFYTVLLLVWFFPGSWDGIFVRYAKASHSIEKKREFLKVSFLIKGTFGLTIILISFPLSVFLAKHAFDKPELVPLIVLALLCGVLLSFVNTIASVFQEKERFGTYAMLISGYNFPVLGALLVYRFMGGGVTLFKVISTYVFVCAAIGLLSIILLLSKVGDEVKLDNDALKKSIQLGKWAFATSCLFIFFTRLDTLFMTRFVDFDAIGVYNVASQFTVAITLLSGSLSGIILPRSSVALDTKQNYATFRKESYLIVSLISLMTVLLFVFAGQIITLVYGDVFRSGVVMLRVLLVGSLFATVYLPYSYLFYAIEDTRTRFHLEILKFVIALGLLYVMVPAYGAMGAALAMTITLTSNSVFSMWVMNRKIGAFFRLKQSRVTAAA